MIFNYGCSLTGKSHLQQGRPCQDAWYIRQLENGWFVGAAADGVGSCPNAEEGAALAVRTAVDFVCAYMPYDYSLISTKSMLRTALNHVMKTILRHAEEKGLPAENFDTTLSLVIYDGKRITYAHSGDGAIIGLTTFGNLVEITRRQKAEDGISLLPLRAGYTAWEIDSWEEDLAGVIIVTDGVLEALSPYLLKIRGDSQSGFSGAGNLYVPIASFLADPAGIPEDEEGQTILKERIEAYLNADPEYDSDFFFERLEEIYRIRVPEHAEDLLAELKKYDYPVVLMQNSQDDKTAIGFLNTDLTVESQEEEYYKDADWIMLQNIWDRLAYPGLFQEEKAEEKEKKSTTQQSITKWMKRFTRLQPEDSEEQEDENKQSSEPVQ